MRDELCESYYISLDMIICDRSKSVIINQIKSNQIKSSSINYSCKINQIKSNQIKSNQVSIPRYAYLGFQYRYSNTGSPVFESAR